MLITLTTDFGDSEYVGAMKGVIRRLNPDVEIIDITHGICRQSIRHGAYALLTAAPHFPPAVHVGVVDPGVGTERRALAIAVEGGYLVGPDNGVLIPAARHLGVKEVRHATNMALGLPEVSATFHGRDVFAPLAAHLAGGIKFRDVGPIAERWTDLDFGRAAETPEGLAGQVIAVDHFGNVITNVHGAEFMRRFRTGDTLNLAIGDRTYEVRCVRTYAEGAPNEPVVLVGSGGFLEVAVNRGEAHRTLGVGEAEAFSLTGRR